MYTSTGRRRPTYTVAQAVIGARTFLLIYPSLGVRLSTCFLDSPTKLSPGTYLSKPSMIISAELNPLFNHFRNLCQWLVSLPQISQELTYLLFLLAFRWNLWKMLLVMRLWYTMHSHKLSEFYLSLSKIFAINPYWLLWASSAMTTMLSRSERRGYFSLPTPGKNFWMVVNTIPPEETASSFCSSFDSALTGSCRRIYLHLPNVPNSWPSRSFYQ